MDQDEKPSDDTEAAAPQAAALQDADLTVQVAPAKGLVLGHDGSAGADEALRVALELGLALSAPLTIVRAWSLVTAPRPPDWSFGYVSSVDEVASAVEAELMSQTQEQVSTFADVAVAYRVYNAGPAQSLIRASVDARMLIVGARGLGGLRELVLGSVSDQCVRHAHCPVLVTRQRSR
jgi:nucleotide-binding universal stress UspA family protein